MAWDLVFAKAAADASKALSKNVFMIASASPREGGEVSTSAKGGDAKEAAAAGAAAQGAASNLLLTVAAAASGLALLCTGYYYWVNSELDESSERSSAEAEADQAESEAALAQAREALRMEWTQTCELNKASKGTMGFEAWWSMADGNSKKALLQSARDLMRQRLLEHQPDAAVALDVLCPEIGDANLDRLVRGTALVSLIKLRITMVDHVRKHDVNFVKENLAQQVNHPN